MFQEFKKFIVRGNVMDLAVGVIMGSAFTAIVTSLVKNLINPLIGLIIGRIDLSSMMFRIAGANFKYGAFISAVINFIIIALVVFCLVKGINRLMPKHEKVTGPTSTDYLEEIRDLLKNQANK